MGADGGVHAEAAAGLPGEHVGDGEVVEEAAPLEEAEHATLQGALEAVDVVGGAVCRLVEGDGAIERCRKETAPSWASPGRPGWRA